ncbi:MAG: anthranilate synthase component I [Alphaproteobacteria bacterium]|nr:anthranilate synthase component I [Alphaproteobacteria bacterium]
MFLPDYDTFEKNVNAGKTQLLSHTMPADMDTPVSAYLKLCGHAPHGFLFESVEGGKNLGRYSIIGHKPDLIWNCQDGNVTVTSNNKTTTIDADALTSLREYIGANTIDEYAPNLPPMAVSGLFGYLGYDMVRLIEDIPCNNPDDLAIPDSILIRPTILVIFDNVKNDIIVVTPVYAHSGNSVENAKSIYDAAYSRLQNAIDTLDSALPEDLKSSSGSNIKTPLPVTSNMSEDDYKNAVVKAKDYIKQGEIFQVVPGQRFSVDFDLPSFDLYRSLRRMNPSPFMFHLSFDGFSIVGSSPEILVRVRDNTVTIRPIAGTRKRGETAAQDQALADDLLADEKEYAEHLMLLDLGRNDIGRVSEFGSINITEQFIIERYSHVMHIVSNVEGKLHKDKDSVDALFAGFPAGTVSGAPKVRAMQIIDELEANKRSYYGGGIGYFSGNGDLDTCIALRTALVKDNKVYVQAGAGIVADSVPQSEYDETVNKSKAIIKAAESAIERANINRR